MSVYLDCGASILVFYNIVNYFFTYFAMHETHPYKTCLRFLFLHPDRTHKKSTSKNTLLEQIPQKSGRQANQFAL
jgi:hypothetical protein